MRRTHSAFLDLLRLSPTGLPRLKGKVLSGEVVPSAERGKFVRVDAGWRAHVSLLRAELEQAQRRPVRVGDEVQLAVEHVETPLGEAALDAERARDNERADYVWQEIKDAYARGLQVKARARARNAPRRAAPAARSRQRSGGGACV